MHARKTRERKKLQTVALQNRVTELQEEVNTSSGDWNEMFFVYNNGFQLSIYLLRDYVSVKWWTRDTPPVSSLEWAVKRIKIHQANLLPWSRHIWYATMLMHQQWPTTIGLGRTAVAPAARSELEEEENTVLRNVSAYGKWLSIQLTYKRGLDATNVPFASSTFLLNVSLLSRWSTGGNATECTPNAPEIGRRCFLKSANK
jgi:hypothetical protein